MSGFQQFFGMSVLSEKGPPTFKSNISKKKYYSKIESNTMFKK